MDPYSDELPPIISLLKANPRGMSVTDIAAAVGVNRNTVSRYLDVLLISGQAEMRTYGKAKVFFLSQRVPISAMLNFSSDIVVVIDRETRIMQANDAACSFAGADRDDLLGKEMARSPLAAFDHPLIRTRIAQALNGADFVEELRFVRQTEIFFFRIKILPTVFNDGSPGVTIILEDISEKKRAEEALRESENMFRALVENINDLIWNLSESGTFTYVSPKSRDLLGYAPEEMVGKTPCDFMAPGDAERARDWLRSLNAETPSSTLFECTMLHKDGRPVFLEANGTAVFDIIGEFTGYRFVCRDITERQHAIRKVKKWKSFLYSVVNNIPSMVFVKELKGQTFVFFNHAAVELLGRTSEDMAGKCAKDIFPEDMALFLGNDNNGLLEKTFLVGNGSGRILRVKKVPISDSRGEAKYMLGIAEDVTDRKIAEDLLVAQRDRAQSYLDVAGVMIAVIGADGRIELMNRKGCRILGYTEAELVGKDWFAAIVPERLRERLGGNFMRLMAGDAEPSSSEVSPVLTTSGDERQILWHNTLLRDTAGRVVAMVSSGEEVGE